MNTSSYTNALLSFFSRWIFPSDDHVAATLSDRSFVAEKSLALLLAYIKRVPDAAVRLIRFSTSAIACVRGGRKKRRRPLAARKNARCGPAESLMRATERVARLRATNNSCLYPFPFSHPLLSYLSYPYSFSFLHSFPLSFPFPADTRTSSSPLSFLSFRTLSASFVRRSNSNSCRKNLPAAESPHHLQSGRFRSQNLTVNRPISDPYLPSTLLSSRLSCYVITACIS